MSRPNVLASTITCVGFGGVVADARRSGRGRSPRRAARGSRVRTTVAVRRRERDVAVARRARAVTGTEPGLALRVVLVQRPGEHRGADAEHASPARRRRARSTPAGASSGVDAGASRAVGAAHPSAATRAGTGSRSTRHARRSYSRRVRWFDSTAYAATSSLNSLRRVRIVARVGMQLLGPGPERAGDLVAARRRVDAEHCVEVGAGPCAAVGTAPRYRRVVSRPSAPPRSA